MIDLISFEFITWLVMKVLRIDEILSSGSPRGSLVDNPLALRPSDLRQEDHCRELGDGVVNRLSGCNRTGWFSASAVPLNTLSETESVVRLFRLHLIEQIVLQPDD